MAFSALVSMLIFSALNKGRGSSECNLSLQHGTTVREKIKLAFAELLEVIDELLKFSLIHVHDRGTFGFDVFTEGF